MARTVDNGYGAAHKRLKASYAPRVARGDFPCWRCGLLIDPDERPIWELGHDDFDRSITRGPEHYDCNRRRLPRTGPAGWRSEEW